MRIFSSALAFTAMTFFAHAEEAAIGPIEVSNVVVLQTGPSQLFGTASMDIRNSGDVDDHLVEIIADFADGAFQIRAVDAAGFAKQVIVDEGVPIPAGMVTSLSADGHQIAFLNLKNRLMGGETYTIIMKFETAGELVLSFPITGLGG